MFDIGFSEMAVIGVVALIVIGPEKLPQVARTVGVLLGRAQRYVGDIKSDIKNQIQLEELKKLQEQMATEAREMENSVKQQVQSVEASLNETVQALTQTAAQATEQPTQLAAPLKEEELYRGEPEHKAAPSMPAATPIAAAAPVEANAEKSKS